MRVKHSIFICQTGTLSAWGEVSAHRFSYQAHPALMQAPTCEDDGVPVWLLLGVPVLLEGTQL